MFGKIFGKVVKRLDKTGDTVQALQELDAQKVLAGIPEAAPSREDEPVTNAELAYIHSKGAPMHNIPARPFMEPSIEKNRDAIARLQGKIIKSALEGKAIAVQAETKKLGLYVSSEAKKYFTAENGWAPNAPSTISAKGSDKPLIDTSNLRNAITYVLEGKNQ